MFSREKKALFPFILLRLLDPEGMGAATGLGVSPVPLVPQEIVHLQRRSPCKRKDIAYKQFQLHS
ncbi:hypothetical protein ACQCVP_17045 [Rossellomorea vietnamensis]|uniref:hypothetical protein n=1 Tax=Rossellomorea vietnamensis TaxID=218284 RepID=UPI003CEEEA53